VYIRRFPLGWKKLGLARRFQAQIVNHTDDFRIVGKAPAAEMLTATAEILERLKLPVNMQKTRCLRSPEVPFEFPGYRIGINYRPQGRGAYIGTRPSKASVESICRKVSGQTASRFGWMETEQMILRLNSMLLGWSSYFCLGQVSPDHAAVDRHAGYRLRRWLCRKHGMRSGKQVQFPDRKLYEQYGSVRLSKKASGLPWAKA